MAIHEDGGQSSAFSDPLRRASDGIQEGSGRMDARLFRRGKQTGGGA